MRWNGRCVTRRRRLCLFNVVRSDLRRRKAEIKTETRDISRHSEAPELSRAFYTRGWLPEPCPTVNWPQADIKKKQLIFLNILQVGWNSGQLSVKMYCKNNHIPSAILFVIYLTMPQHHQCE